MWRRLWMLIKGNDYVIDSNALNLNLLHPISKRRKKEILISKSMG
jgi:hypothetical protein